MGLSLNQFFFKMINGISELVLHVSIYRLSLSAQLTYTRR